MIRFKNWYITAEKEVIARQHDNLTRRLDIVGDIPTGWEWSLLTGIGEEMCIRDSPKGPAGRESRGDCDNKGGSIVWKNLPNTP